MARVRASLSFLLAAVLATAAPAAGAEPVAPVLSHEIVRATEEARRNGEASFIPLKDGSLLLLYGAHSKPGDWDRGEMAGLAAAKAVQGGGPPAGLDADRLVRELCRRKFMVSFLNDVDVGADDPRVAAAQYFGTQGFFADYDARLDVPLATATQAVWDRGLAALRSRTLAPADLVKQVHQAEQENSPPTGRTRGEAMLAMWRSLEK